MAEKITIDEAKAKIDERVSKAVAKWWEEVWPKIDEEVKKTLDEQMNNIICRLLGFTNTWGRWEIRDTSKDSVAFKYLKGEGEAAAMQWLEQKFKHVKGRVPPGAHGDATKLYDRVFDETIKKLVRESAEHDARAAFSEHIDSLLKEHGLGKDKLEED